MHVKNFVRIFFFLDEYVLYVCHDEIIVIPLC